MILKDIYGLLLDAERSLSEFRSKEVERAWGAFLDENPDASEEEFVSYAQSTRTSADSNAARAFIKVRQARTKTFELLTATCAATGASMPDVPAPR